MMQRHVVHALVLLAMILLGAAPAAHADTPISLFQSFRGTVNFTGTEAVLRNNNNNNPCSLVATGTAVSASLSGIPSGATILSAQLYWAGSGTTPDYSVTLNGNTVEAPVKSATTITRRYVATSYANYTTYTYFSGAADVTAIVKNKGNGTYTFNDLKVDNGRPWCTVQGVVGGFALVVIYSHPDEPFRMLNLYEGFKDFQNSSLKIDLGDFKVPNPLPANVTGRVGHITWEGDSTLSQGGEDLLFNGYEMTDSLNPKGNQFNSASNIRNDKYSYGVDFDVYTLKSPVIQPGQITGTSVYQSGQDLVILSAEIVAMPYVANADLALSMTRSGDLTVGSSTDYTLTVTNVGIDAEVGPVKVVDTLPAGLKLVSTSGTNWYCTSAVQTSGQTVVTCTQNGPVKPGAKMTPLVIAVTPAETTSYTNSAVVSGVTGDDNSKNNSASNTSSSTDYYGASVAFTKESCTPGQKIVTVPTDAGCHKFIGPVVAADTNTRIYITAVTVKDGAQVATALDTKDNTLPIELRFSCLPNAGNVPISYAGLTNFDCAGNPKTVNVKLPANKATGVLADNGVLGPFFYADVGRVSLSMRVYGTLMGTVNFISKPSEIRFRDIVRVSDDYQDPGGLSGSTNWAKPDIGFAVAGEPFLMRVGAMMADGKWAPSFGNEAAALKGVLPAESLDLDFELDYFAVNLKGSPKVGLFANTDTLAGVVQDALVLDKDAAGQDFRRSTKAGLTNMFEVTARYFEAGNLAITPWLEDYLGTGQVGGPSTSPMGSFMAGTRVVGRFYPDHFETTATANFVCPASMNCPAAAGASVNNGGTYSMQPFTFAVKAFGLPKPGGGGPTPLALYQNIIIDPAKPRPLTLTASKAPNLSQAPGVGAFVTDPGTQLGWPTGAAANDFPDLGGTATWRLGAPYDPAKRSASTTWGAPTAVYLRAAMDEFRGAGTSSTKVTVSSLTPAGAAADTQYEGGLMVVAGRMFVPNVFGSDLMRLPVAVSAQYWNGSAWTISDFDDDSTVGSAIKPVAKSCRQAFAVDATGTCKSATPLALAGTYPLRLTDGRGTLTLAAPARGTLGGVDYTFDNSAAPWLPSTQARATFGIYRSPLIYLREVY